MSLVGGNDDTIVVTMGIYVDRAEVENGTWQPLLENALEQAKATLKTAVTDEIDKRGWVVAPAKDPANG